MLTFDQLQQANIARGKLWVQDCDEKPGLLFAAVELGGEAGECMNKIKKLERFRLGMAGGEDNLPEVADEIADVVICASLLANKLSLDLGEITARKFNKTSEKRGFPVKL
jgi:NTP pyrophosphatase (non-canonical NTP hydrolase)